MTRRSIAETDRAPRRRSRRRKKGLRLYLSNLLIIVGIVLLGAAGYLWGTAQWRYRQQDKVNRELARYVTIDEGTVGAGGAASGDGADGAKSKPPVVDWAGLKAINEEVCGWLQVPGTTINYPVYQTTNNEYYLRHSAATGEWTVGGQLFIDYENTNPGMADQLTLVYGHHLNDGSMFEQIAEMDEQERFDRIDTLWYITETYNWELEPLFMYYVQPEDPDARKFVFESSADFTEYLKGKLARAVTKRSDAADVVERAEHVLVLATCNYYDGYGRSLLVCVPKEEAERAQTVAEAEAVAAAAASEDAAAAADAEADGEADAADGEAEAEVAAEDEYAAEYGEYAAEDEYAEYGELGDESLEWDDEGW